MKTSHDDTARAAYLDLLKRTLVNWLYHDIERHELLRLGDYALVKRPLFDPQRRGIGRDFSIQAHTLVGFDRLDNIQHCAETVISENIAGDFIETGVWRGGCCVFMRGLLKAYGIKDRTVWVADSFQGLPKPNEEQYPDDKGSRFHEMNVLAVPVESVKEIFERYGLLDDQVRFLKGWFRDTLPDAPIEKLAVLRLDGDMYESTMDVLSSLYDRVSPGGFIIVDDYGAYAACRKAVHDFRDEHGVSEPIREIDWTGVYWRKA
ncbi:MAG: TylF/MycF family methyltransferase [Gammaproteobacteria bacterium]|nr:TylF/MycF family methyltransferase [Gammaproteobacteria bacterium]